MQIPRKMRDVVLCVLLLGLPVLFLRSNLKQPDETNFLDRLVLQISAPVQLGITAVVGGIHRSLRRYVYLVGLQENNEQLSLANMKLKRELREAQRQLRRLKHYEKLLAFRTASRLETVGARVIARGSSSLVRTLRLRLDRGSSSGLRSGFPVVTADGVIGRLTKVYGGYAEVRLAVDPKSAIGVTIVRTGARGILRGQDVRDRLGCRIDYVLRKEEVKVGDHVVTSGAAGVFPRGLPVGRVSAITEQAVGLYQQVEVSPAVDTSAVDEVLVVLAAVPPVGATMSEPRKAGGVVP